MQDFNFDIRDGVLRKYGGFYPEVIVPEGVTHIGKKAFIKLLFLEKVTLPESLTEVGQEAFFGCSNLKEVIMPSHLKKIGKEAFECCTSLQKITLPEGLKTLEEGVFSDCTNLKQITLPESLESISRFVLYDCKTLEELSLPYHLRYVNPDAIDYKTNIKFSYRDIYFYSCCRNDGRAFVSVNPGYCILLIRDKEFKVPIPFHQKLEIALQLFQQNPKEIHLLHYLETDFTDDVESLIFINEMDTLKKIIDFKLIQKNSIDALIRYANEQKQFEMQVLLTNYKREHFGFESIEDKAKNLFLD